MSNKRYWQKTKGTKNFMKISYQQNAINELTNKTIRLLK